MKANQRVYRIVRIFSGGRKSEIIKQNQTLMEAASWCSDPLNRKDGEWFDAFIEEKN